MATYTLRTNYTNNVSDATLRSSTNPLSSIVTTREVNTTQSGAYLYNLAYLHADSGYEFTSLGNLSFVLDGSAYTLGSGVVDAALSSGIIIIQTTLQVPPGQTFTLVINGAAEVVTSPSPSPSPSPSSTPIGSSGRSSNITLSPSLGVGNLYNFNNSSSIQIKHREHFNVLNKNDDWAVSFWAIIPPSQSLDGRTQQGLVQKRNTYTYIDDAGLEQVKSQGTGQYPFDISFYTELDSTSPGHIFVRASDGISTLNFSSSNAYNDGEAHEYVLNKTNSEIALWVDGTKEVSASYSFKGIVTNDRDILIGARGITETNGFFSGSMAQFRIHRTSLTADEITSLSNGSTEENSIYDAGTALQRKEVGYIFYKQGMIIVSDPRPRYQNVFLGDGNWNYIGRNFELKYRATKQVEEFSILCEIKRDEYNVSSNPSLRIDGTDTDTRLMNMVTGSDFRPYITQIGLYNDNGDLLAIGKLGSPLKKRQDVDVTINVKFDLD